MPDPFTPGAVPIFEDRLSTIMSLNSIVAWDLVSDIDNGVAYFESTGFTRGVVPKITTGNELFIPTQGPPLVSSFAEIITIENNTATFFEKQEMLFQKEGIMFEAWIKAIEKRNHPVLSNVSTVLANTASLNLPNSTRQLFIFGPYIDLSFGSESNKYYGISNTGKSAWLQRSLTRGVIIETESVIQTQNVVITPIVPWKTVVTPPIPGIHNVTYPNFGSIPGIASFIGIIDAYYSGGGYRVLFTETVFFSFLPTYRYFMEQISNPGGIQFNIDVVIQPGITGSFAPGTIYAELSEVIRTRTQEFRKPRITYQYYPTCTYTQLAHTKIKGHGHYLP
jgi:hypothetical protein